MPYQPTVVGTRYMVAAGHYLATQAAFDILPSNTCPSPGTAQAAIATSGAGMRINP